MASQNEVIETTVGKVAAELAKRGLDPDDRVTITIEPDELIPGRRASRARVVAAGLSDDDSDRLISASVPLQFSDHQVGSGRAFYDQAHCKNQPSVHGQLAGISK